MLTCISTINDLRAYACNMYMHDLRTYAFKYWDTCVSTSSKYVITNVDWRTYTYGIKNLCAYRRWSSYKLGYILHYSYLISMEKWKETN